MKNNIKENPYFVMLYEDGWSEQLREEDDSEGDMFPDRDSAMKAGQEQMEYLEKLLPNKTHGFEVFCVGSGEGGEF